MDLLLRLKSIERAMGRSGGHEQAREIDIDIISLGDMVMSGPELILPHPRFAERAFVLWPLEEIAPDFTCPQTGRSLPELKVAMPPGQEIYPVSGRRMVWAD
jgi:2-amino-4-hydroxy-6-hydroxymethyldihydropteridine diphosphokinase